MDLSNKKCVPCEGTEEPFTDAQIETYLQSLEGGWEIEEDEDDRILSREYEFGDFKEAMAFANKVADIAEKEQHHPDLHIYYGRVVIDLWTHAIGGLSENDFIIASKIDQLK